MSFKHFALIGVLGLLALTACGGVAPVDMTATAGSNPEEGEAGEASGAEGGDLSDDIVIDGSSTVYPITVAVAEEFSASYPDVRVSVGLSGTGGGFEKFCNGETDISDASRPIKDEEAEACTANGIEYVEMLIALDGLTVVVNPDNDWVQCLSAAQLAQVFGINSSVTNWSNIDPSWPDEPILFYVPDPDSGTRDYMIEVIEKADEAATDIRQDENTTNSSDDNTLLSGVANDTYALGFFGYAYYQEAEGQVRAVSIENSDGGCIDPSNETVQDGTYNPLSRPLFIYPSVSALTEKPQVAEFVRFYMEQGAETVMGDVGYSLPPEGTFEENLSLLDETLGQ